MMQPDKLCAITKVNEMNDKSPVSVSFKFHTTVGCAAWKRLINLGAIH